MAKIFDRLADFVEIQGGNPFRVHAYRDGARTVGDLPQEVAALVTAGNDLSKLDRASRSR
jgi:DNA polymerase (family X)